MSFALSNHRRASPPPPQTFKLVCNEALNNGRFSFPGFGTFRVVATPERRARNPKTSAVMTVPASHRIGFRASSDLKKNLRALEQNKFPKKEKKPKE